jgi:hypothetical protein
LPINPARLGTTFGLRYQLAGKGAEDQPLTLLYFTPGVRTPDRQRHDKFEVIQKWGPGKWHFMVFQGDRLLTQQRFTVR